MNRTSFHILRVGTAITFIWIAILIFKDPLAWGGFVAPWVVNMLPVSLESAMIGTAILDLVIGIFLLFNVWVWMASLLASIHLIVILVVSGINEATVRDIAILSGTILLFLDSVPEKILEKLPALKKFENI